MTEVYVTSGNGGDTYHTFRDCYQLQKGCKVVKKRLDHIQVFYRKCSVCDAWECDEK